MTSHESTSSYGDHRSSSQEEDPPVALSSLEYEDPESSSPNLQPVKPEHRNSINVASLARALEEEDNDGGSDYETDPTVAAQQLMGSSQPSIPPRRNSLNVASFMRSKERQQQEENGNPIGNAAAATNRHHHHHHHYNPFGTRPLRVSLDTVRRHTRTFSVVANHPLLASTISEDHQHRFEEETASISFPVFTVPEYDNAGQEVLVDGPENNNEDHHQQQRGGGGRHVAVTFGAYHDDHNDEVIPELVKVIQNEDATESLRLSPDGAGGESDSAGPTFHFFHRQVRKFQDVLAETPVWIQILSTNLACLFTHALLRAHPELDPQFVTMIMVTLCGATFPHLITAVACGVYAGSVNTNTLPSFLWVILLGIITSLVWQVVSAYKLLLGLGGRLGASAFVAMNVTASFAFWLDSSVSFDRYGLSNNSFQLEEALVSTAACIFLASTSGYMRLIAQVPVNPVLLPSAWALFCILATSLAGDYPYSPSIFGGYAVGAYVGMSSVAKLPSFWSFSIVGLIAGVWMQLFRPICLGFGGKSGFTALVGVVTYEMIQRVFKHSTMTRTPQNSDSLLPK